MSVIESMDTMQAWTIGLRLAMGYPQRAPACNPINYASGGRKNIAEALGIAAIVEQTNRDFVLVQFDLPISDGPIGISLATRGNVLVEWHTDVQPYLASDDGIIELLSDTHRWSVGPRAILTASPLPSAVASARRRTRAPALAASCRSDARSRIAWIDVHPRRRRLRRRHTDGSAPGGGVRRHQLG